VAGIRYSLVYENTWVQDVCRIEPHPLKWEALFHAAEEFLERKPEVITRKTKSGSLVFVTRDYGFQGMPHMYVLFRILRLADPSEDPVPPGGQLSLRHVITEEDVRMGLFYDYSQELLEECQELRAALLQRED
jgi:hypothetical protein